MTRRGIPFVFVTGNGGEGLPKSFSKAPILSKPFTQEQLLSEAGRLIEQQERAMLIPLNQEL